MDQPPLPDRAIDAGPPSRGPRSDRDDVADRPPASSLEALLIDVLGESRSLGFLGPGPLDAHVRHARAMLPQVEGARRVLDLGSGGGLPGLVLAAHLEVDLVLLDAMQRRCDFLTRAVERLELTRRVSVRWGRAEQLAREVDLRHRFDLVVARSFGPPAVTAECAAGFLEGAGARVLVSEPPGGAPDRWPDDGLRTLGLSRGRSTVVPPAAIQELVAVERCGDRIPRRVGIPAKRPLF